MSNDQQGNPIEVGNAYQRIVGMPGPDVSLVVVDEIRPDGRLLVRDLYFRFECECQPKELFRPLKRGWHEQDLKLIAAAGGKVELP